MNDPSPPPAPPRDDVSRPSGEPGNLRVLDWAGFRSAVSYTFDDALPSHVEHYGALRAAGADVTFYVPSDRDASADAWRAIAADGNELGNHTASHPHGDLTGGSFGTPRESRRAELDACASYLTEDLDQPGVSTMASPFGDRGWRDAARETGLLLNRGVGGGTVAPDGETDPYELPSYVAQAGDTAETFDRLVDDARDAGEWLLFTFHSIAPTDEEGYAPVAVDELAASIEHAATAGDVWVDTVARIGSYWRAQRFFEGVTPTEVGDETVWEWECPDAFPDGHRLRVTVDGGTLEQNGRPLPWNGRGYYEVSLDAESLTLTP
ncbi:polysaccharide deacetylase family protein [Halorubrum sp. DM2]|uniref:polysaccharide deacetylase family protein n=1 Tax=Halorubrum sp. DM2 TaxID=2527867 RepID=UPI0024B637A8|nr:polysaccharide deacetylase family protein [Halorubrum sp. DM2]